MIPVFPESPFPVLPLIEFLARPSCSQLNRARNNVSFAVVSYQKVDVIGGDHVVKHTETIALLRLEEPLKVPASVPGKLEQEFFFVAAVRNMPHTPWKVMPIRPRHFPDPSLEAQFLR